MHPRNPYVQPPDFAALARHDAALRPFVGAFPFPFDSADAMRALTRALLAQDFGVRVELLSDRLCPTIPSRLNYILWIEDIMDAWSPFEPGPSARAPRSYARGLDVGTGSIAVYALLACARNPHWCMVGTDVDRVATAHAARVVQGTSLRGRAELGDEERTAVGLRRQKRARGAPRAADPPHPALRNLHQRITLVERAPSDPLLDVDRTAPFHFSMCNPPFYASLEERAAAAAAKREPHSTCEAADAELYTPGGEAAFVLRMVDESVQLQGHIGWYTTMLGKLSSVAQVVTRIKRETDNYGVTEFVQGRTRRWGVAWSFRGSRLPDSVARCGARALAALQPRTTCRVVQWPAGLDWLACLRTLRTLPADETSASKC
ncbi:23S rRNA (adenine(1618)-N(6))-methyltransferase [Malassezia sp. CBS 17886]|nr:23S rRNA (adenine(1618)-N(6))-methyltransferase [Malassezia sp. CBS 17886]